MFFSKKTTGNNVFVCFLECLHVKHTKKFSNKYYGEHPHKYNLYGLSKMLTDYGLENRSYKITEKEKLYQLDVPFIAHTGSDFVVVTKFLDQKVYFIWNGKKQSASFEDFLSKWTGVVLLAETNEKTIEPNYERNRKSELFNNLQHYILYSLICILGLILYFNHSLYTNLGLTLLLIINLIGIFIGFLLVAKQINAKSNYADKICSLFKQSDCNNILFSKTSDRKSTRLNSSH